jgi:hypothetical protein
MKLNKPKLHKRKLTSSGPLFKAAEVLPIQQTVMLRTAIMVYKSLNNWVPKYISDMFVLKAQFSLLNDGYYLSHYCW